MRQSLGSLFEAWENYRLDSERKRGVDDRVGDRHQASRPGWASGVKVDSRCGDLITVETRPVVQIEVYSGAPLALEIAGLGEAEVGT
jgi:hypothetical protein